MRGRDRIALACCAVTLGFCALAFGGATRWAAIAAALGAIAMAGVYIGSRRIATERSPLMVLIAVAIGLTAIQLVPLPSALAGIVAGDKLELVEQNAKAWHADAPATVMASYDPPATLVELAKLCGYAALAFAACRLAAHRRGRRALAIVAVGTALGIAVVAVAHAAIGANEIYGAFSTPAAPRLLSPIINDNHLAAVMALAVPLALGLALTTERIARIAWLGAAFACAAVALVISSRGGAIGLIAGATVTIVLLVVQRRQDRSDRRPRVFGRHPFAQVTIAGCVVVLVGALTATQVFGELARTRLDEMGESHSKFQVWVQATDMLAANRWLGVGRGAFEPAFTRYSEVGDTAYSHAENSYLQPVLDWGIPGALAIAIAMGFVVIAVAKRWKHGAIEAGALGALASLAVHDLADFSLELPLVAMLAILAFAILVPARVGTGETADGKVRPVSARRVWWRTGVLAAAAVVCVVAATPLGRLAHAEAAGDDLQAASERHPADYLLMGRAAQALMDLHDPRAVGVIQRALALNPNHAGIHRLAGVLLLRSGHPQQAQVELALALRHAPPGLFYQLLTEIAATFPDPKEAAGALPIDPLTAPQVLAALREYRRTAIELAYTQRLAILGPDDAAAQLALAQAAVRMGRGDLALPAARLAHRLRPDIGSTIALARASGLTGAPDAAIATLTDALTNATPAQRLEVLTALADLELDASRFDALAQTLDQLAQLEPDEAGRLDLHRRRATLHDRRGETNQATWEREQIRQIESGRSP